MHNCRETKEQITELLLDGPDRRPDEVLSAELRGCAECRSEFDPLKATLRITNRLSEISTPSEDYWTTYHAKLRQKLTNVNTSSHETRDSRIVSFFKFSIPVPAPIAVAAIVLCIVLAAFATRTQQPIAQTVRIPVEVPVLQERVVTRVVYRDRKQRSKRVSGSARVESTFAKSEKPRDGITPSLVGFKPTEEVKLTVIKGGSGNEK
jgi:hypothetical protein